MVNKSDKKVKPNAISKRHDVRVMNLADLKPAAYNPRTISTRSAAGLKASMERFGVVDPLIVNKQTGFTIVGGHQRYEVMKAQGIAETQVVIVDLSEEEERALDVTLNNPLIAGDFSSDLVSLLDQIRHDAAVDFKAVGLEDLLATLKVTATEVVEDTPPQKPKNPVTKRGDVIILGQHRLICGDATNVDDVNKVLDGKRPKMIFTDPPWNVAIGKDSNPRHRQRKGLENDDLGDKFEDFLHGWTAACLTLLDGDLYCVLGFSEMHRINAMLIDAGIHWSGTIAWIKDQFVLGRSNYQKRWEPIWYGWPNKNKSSFNGARDVDDVWEFPRPKVSEDHPTMKPVGLVAKAVHNSSRTGNLVFDPFSGAGSTLLACQQTDRIFSGIEIDPGYCDVIVKRWENFTGKKALR